MSALVDVRVAHLIESDGPGGAERMLATLARSLQEAGVANVAVLPANQEGWLTAELRSFGIPVEHVLLHGPSHVQCAQAVAGALARHRPALAHSHDFMMTVYGAWAARRVGARHVVTMHGSPYYSGRWHRRLALRGAVLLGARLVAVSARLADALRRDLWLPSDGVALIPNGVRFAPAAGTRLRAELNLGRDDRIALAVGNLYPVKGHAFLVEALGLLAAKFPTLHVAIAGRGDLEPALMRQAQQAGVAHRLHLLGLRDDIPALLADADVFVMPSLSEGLPVSLLEAMAAARPIVASDVGDMGVALDQGRAGVLVAAGNANALAESMGHLLSDSSRAAALGAAAQSRARTEYDSRAMHQRYVRLYEQLLGGRLPIVEDGQPVSG